MTAPAVSRADAPGDSSPSDPAAAQSLFDAGRSLMEAGNAAEACPKFEESNRLDPSAGTLLNLGKCFEKLGRTASAWAAYKRAAVVGRAKGQTRHVEAADQFAAELEPKLSRLVVTVARDVEGLRLFRGENEISPAARGVPVAVDPGRYEIRAEAPGQESWKRTIEIVAGGQTLTVEIPALAGARKEPPPPPVVPASKGPRVELLVGGAVVGGVGLVGLAVGAGFGAATLSDASDARESEELCPEGRCTARGWQVIQDAEDKATISTALLVVGGIAAATGATLLMLGFVLEPEAERQPAALSIAPALGPGFTGVAVGGSL